LQECCLQKPTTVEQEKECSNYQSLILSNKEMETLYTFLLFSQILLFMVPFFAFDVLMAVNYA